MACRKELFRMQFGESYYEDDILKLLKSSKPEDKQKLNDIIAHLVSKDYSEALEYLLERGLKIGKINSSRQTFLHRAFYMGTCNILSSKINYWLPYITEDVVNIVDSNGITLLHIACHATNSQMLIQKCLECNADINAKDSKGRTPLHVACLVFEDLFEDQEFVGIYVNYIELLLNNNADINARDNSGNTPLLSLFPDSYKIFSPIDRKFYFPPSKEIWLKLKMLVERGADVTLSNQYDETIVHLIIKKLDWLRYIPDIDSKSLPMIQQVLSVCPTFNIDIENTHGETPLKLAIYYLSTDILKIFLDHYSYHFQEDLDYWGRKCFNYLLSHSKIQSQPQIEEVVTFLRIIELLIEKNFEINAGENLKILEYLTHDSCDGKCVLLKTDHRNEINKVLDALNYASLSYFESVCKKLSQSRLLISCYLLMQDPIGIEMKYIKHANFCIDFTELEVLKQIRGSLQDVPLSQDKLKKLDCELLTIKSIKLTESVSLYDVMSKHPHNIYKYIQDVNLNSIVKKYSYYEKIIKRHLTKSLVRHYVEKNAFDSLVDLLPSDCPSLCCEKIMDYLTNKDILNVCRAVLDDE